MASRFWNMWWNLKVALWRVRCWFRGHNEVARDWPSLDTYCDKCFIDEPADRLDLPTILNHRYVWVVERNWQWFERFDIWLCDNHGKRLPHWWSY